MAQELHEALGTLEVESPREHGSLRVFGLRWPAPPSAASYVTLDEALQSQSLAVTEVSESGNVPRLQVVNSGDTMVFIMAGEELVGAKQNRILNVSIMVRPHSEQPIPVSCVEAGRWAYRSRAFSSSGALAHSILRGMVSKQVHTSYQRSGIPTSAQGAVWQEIASKLQRMGSKSASSELRQAFEDRRARLDETLHELTPPTGCAGAAFAIGSRIIGLDLFDRPETLVKLWPKIVRSYAIDALEWPDQTATVAAAEVCAWLGGMTQAKTETFRSPGLGQDVRIEAPAVHGAALLVDDQPVHVEVFADHPA